jgi:hypothetical protein
MLGQIKKIRADLSENMLKSGYFITILNKNSVKLSTPPPPPENISPVLLWCYQFYPIDVSQNSFLHGFDNPNTLSELCCYLTNVFIHARFFRLLIY